MTFREKFKEVFGVEYEEFDTGLLDEKYGKLKLYKVKCYEHYYRNFPNPREYNVEVYAKDKQTARNEAIKKLGGLYQRFRHSDKPTMALKIWRADGGEEECMNV